MTTSRLTLQSSASSRMEKLPQGRLPHDLATRKLETASSTVTMLATAFLNLAAECKQALPKGQTVGHEYLSEITGPISEEKLRSLELRFHNLQSLYDGQTLQGRVVKSFVDNRVVEY